MILDTSAVVAIVLFAQLQRDARSLLARFLSEASIAIVPFGESHYGAAVDAWLRYGKGRHPAALNFGDCLSYAVARLANEPLLFVGDDFAQTDIART
jgi:ribonuclease VapC